MDLKIGDVVMLKSGSDDMTITRVSGNECKCEWFRWTDHTIQSALISKDALAKKK